MNKGGLIPYSFFGGLGGEEFGDFLFQEIGLNIEGSQFPLEFGRCFPSNSIDELLGFQVKAGQGTIALCGIFVNGFGIGQSFCRLDFTDLGNVDIEIFTCRFLTVNLLGKLVNFPSFIPTAIAGVDAEFISCHDDGVDPSDARLALTAPLTDVQFVHLTDPV